MRKYKLYLANDEFIFVNGLYICMMMMYALYPWLFFQVQLFDRELRHRYTDLAKLHRMILLCTFGAPEQ